MTRYLLAIAVTLLAVAPASAQWFGSPAANTPNPVNTNGGISFTMCWDGSAWDPCSTAGGGGGSFDGVLLDAAAGDAITDTANNALRVNVVAGAGSGGTALADDADFTAGTTSFTPFGGFYQSTVTACTDGDTCAAGITTGRAVKVALANADGSLATYAADVTEDAAETAGGAGPMVLSVRRDTAASSAGASGDNATFNTDSLGRLWTRVGNPCNDHSRIQTAAISNSTSGNVEVVALNGSDLIYVCGYSLMAGATTGVRFVYGTGTACATGETGLTGAWPFAANGGIQQPNTGAPQFVVPAGNAFCTENTGANAIAGHVTYVRTAAP